MNMIDVIIIIIIIMMSKFFKLLVVSILMFYTIVFCLFFVLNRQKKKFNPDRLNVLTDSISTQRDVTDDLCKYALYGDPFITGGYVKLEFNCLNGNKSTNSISLSPIKTSKLIDIVKEFSRIVNYNFDLWNMQSWHCYIKDKEVMLATDIESESDIKCFEGND